MIFIHSRSVSDPVFFTLLITQYFWGIYIFFGGIYNNTDLMIKKRMLLFNIALVITNILKLNSTFLKDTFGLDKNETWHKLSPPPPPPP